MVPKARTTGQVAGVDIGGTFTDAVIVGGRDPVTIGKASTTPPEFQVGFMDALETAGAQRGLSLADLLAELDGLYHGCTVGTNALVEQRTAKVGLLATKGHRDSLFMMQTGARNRGMSPEYVARMAGQLKPAPLVAKGLALEVEERIARDGVVVSPLNEGQCREAIGELVALGAEAFAVSFLWSTVNPRHEQRVGELIREVAPNAFVSLSSEVISRVGEYQRTVATVINSLIGPTMSEYLGRLEEDLAAKGFAKRLWIMSCSGGVIEVGYARELPILTVGSGPVAGLIGAGMLATAAVAGEATATRPEASLAADVITADMGGTTLDVGVIRGGRPVRRPTTRLGQFEYFVPTLDVRSVGAGGGSIVRFDESSGSIRVGPRSAGARPGPAAYCQGGTDPTVTDADLVLGYLNPEYFLEGRIKLSVTAAKDALSAVGKNVGFSSLETAAAAARIVDSQMADAIRLASVQQGYDPRRSVMYAYGGAGASHATAIARQLGIETVVVPMSNLASGWSAFGVASADVVLEEERPEVARYPFSVPNVDAAWRDLEARVSEKIRAQHIPQDAVTWERWVSMRYAAQVNAIEIPVPLGPQTESTMAGLITAFEAEYEGLFGQGTGYPAAGYVMTSMKVRAVAALRKSAAGSRGDVPERTPDAEMEQKGVRSVVFYDQGLDPTPTPFYDGREFRQGMTLKGPVIIEYPDTTVVVRAREQASVDAVGSVRIMLAEARL